MKIEAKDLSMEMRWSRYLLDAPYSLQVSPKFAIFDD